MTAKISLGLISGIALTLVVTSVEAQNASPGNTPAPPSNGQTSNQNAPAVATFMADPSALLTRYPLGGGSMVADVRDLVIADLQTVDALLSLVPNTNSEQKNAIGTGLGLAAMSLVRTNPQAGTTIQQALVKLNDQTLLAAYIAVTGDQQLAAAGPGAGGGGGGESATSDSGSSGGVNGPSNLFPTFATINTADSFTFPTLTGSTPGTPPTTVGTPVSPTTP